MAAQKYSARDCEFEIEDYNTPGTWVAFRTAQGGTGEGGINTFSLEPEYETTDTTTFGSEGRAEHQVMQEGMALTLEGFRLKDPSTGALDPAQALAEAQSSRLGANSHTGFRYAAPGDTNWTVWAKASFQLGTQGGGNNDPKSWAVTVTRSGPTTTAVKA